MNYTKIILSPIALLAFVVFSNLPISLDAELCVNCTMENNQANSPLDIIAPDDILTFSTSEFISIDDLGTPIVSGGGIHPVTITNDAPLQFPIGETTVVWTATSGGKKATDTQIVGIASAPSSTDPANKIVLLEFADGWKNIFELGKPIFDKYGIKTTQFIICGDVSTNSPYMTPEMLLTLQSEGHDIQSHTMTHPHLSDLSPQELVYELGGSKDCLEQIGINDVKVFSFPFDDGWDVPEVVNEVSQHYEFARSQTGDLFYLHCNYPESSQNDCGTFDSLGNLNEFHRWSIPTFNHNNLESSNSNDLQTFQDFIGVVNGATLNTPTTINQIPIINYHKINFNNSLEFDSPSFSTSTILLDAELNYLKENDFTVITFSDLHYDQTNDQFFVPQVICDIPSSGDWIVGQSCHVLTDAIAPSSVVIQNNSVVTINSQGSLTIPSGENITIVNGSGLRLVQGAYLDVLS